MDLYKRIKNVSASLASLAADKRIHASLVNTVTDPGVIFGVGNTILNLSSSGTGVTGAAINICATAAGAVLRLRSELRKNFNLVSSTNWLAKKCDSPTSSLKVSGAAQLAVAGLAVAGGDFSKAAFLGASIPAAFGFGNLASARAIDQQQNNVNPVAATLARDGFYTSGLILASGPAAIVTAPVFVASAIYSGVKATKREQSPVPLMGLTTGNEISAVWNGAVGNAAAGVATGLFGAAYASILCQSGGGVYEAIQSRINSVREARIS